MRKQNSQSSQKVYNPPVHHRRSIRLQAYDYSWAGWYYVTVCTRNHECSLGKGWAKGVVLSNLGRIVERSWGWLGQHFPNIDLDEYVIMPNHLHGIVIINDTCRGGSRTAPTEIQSKPLGRLIGAFKTISTKEINAALGRSGTPFWQRNYYEHVIRTDADLYRIRQYIADNPLQWTLDDGYPDNL